VNAPGSVAALRAVRPDLLVVVAFGQILKKEVLGLPRMGAVNLHFSLLPRWRGAAPVARALEAGDPATGVCVQRVARKLDAGPVLARRETPVHPEERAGELEERLAGMGALLLAVVVARAAAEGGLPPGEPQDPGGVTCAARLAKEEGEADFAVDPWTLLRKARAYHPWPLLSSTLRVEGRPPVRVSFHRAAPGRTPPAGAAPGTVLASGREGVEVACGGGSVLFTELQRPGGRPLPAGEFVNGFPIPRGSRMGSDPSRI